MTNAVLVPITGKPERLNINGYNDLSSAVGGYIEYVPILINNNACTAYVNEEGKLINLPVNVQATNIAGVYPHDVICGPMIVIGMPDDEGADTDIPEVVADYLIQGG